MRLLIITSLNDRSETATWCQLARDGVSVVHVGLADAPERETLKAAGVDCHSLNVRHRVDVKAIKAIRQMIADTTPDVIYAPRNATLAAALWAERHAPIIAYRGTTGHLSWFDPASWMTYLHPRIARIICVSNAVRDYLMRMRLPADRLATIYKGHDLAWYQHALTHDRSDYDLPADAFVVGFTGSIRPVKGIDIALKAFSMLPESMNAHFVLIGEVREKHVPELAKQLQIDDRVHFLGFRKDAVALMPMFDAFIMPSLEREGLPRAVIEAMAQSIPVVVTNVGGLPELVQHDESGLTVPPKDAAELASAIRRLHDHPTLRATLGSNGRKRIGDTFSVELTIRRMRELFEAVAAQGAT